MKRLTLATFALLAAVPATARADILWDLVHDAGSGGDYGTSVLLTNDNNCGALNNLTCGTITALSNTTVHVYGNDFLQLVSGAPCTGGIDQNNCGFGSLGAYSMGSLSEKGLGLCFAADPTVPNGCLSASPPFKEIDGDALTGPLYINLTGVLNSGGLNHIWITSTQVGEDWLIEGTTGAIGGVYVEICHGSGQNSAFTDVSDCPVNPAAGFTFLRFTSTTGNGISGDFSVQALRFNSIVPEPGTMGLLATGLVALTGAGFIRRRKKN